MPESGRECGRPSKGSAVVAISGGLDSAIALDSVLRDHAGRDVRALFLDTGFSDPDAARRVADFFDVPLSVLDVRESFREQVIDYSLEALSRGLTPNPCAVCNTRIKFRALSDFAESEDLLATGHYARAGMEGSVLRALDSERDQTYFLALADLNGLRRTVFPMGALSRKLALGRARELGLWFDESAGSQDLCFPLAEMRREVSTGPGPILDREGTRLGTHRGLENYTIGQRRGLGVSLGFRAFVSSVDRDSNSITIEPEPGQGSLTRNRCTLHRLNWLLDQGALPLREMEVMSQVRYRRRPAPALLSPAGRGSTEDGYYVLEFSSPERAVAPGQIAALYVDDRLAGGGFIGI